MSHELADELRGEGVGGVELDVADAKLFLQDLGLADEAGTTARAAEHALVGALLSHGLIDELVDLKPKGLVHGETPLLLLGHKVGNVDRG
jgi:hypothetical protein